MGYWLSLALTGWPPPPAMRHARGDWTGYGSAPDHAGAPENSKGRIMRRNGEDEEPRRGGLTPLVWACGLIALVAGLIALSLSV